MKIGNIKLESKEKKENGTTLIDKLDDVGSTSFMKDKRVGDHETYYLRCLRFYIPNLARHTLITHECGIGIYSMQGFEKRNEESKNCMRKFNNNK